MNKVLVLMSTYNGEKYLQEQLESILNQKGVEVDLLVRDDGSTDSTKTILELYQRDGKVTWYAGDNLRSAKSFMDLIHKSGNYEYFAFSDQDDVWMPDKLECAVKILEDIKDRPAMYYSKTTLVDENLSIMPRKNNSVSPSLSFKTAVVSSNCTGCTVCFNRQLRDIINLYTPNYQIMHDGWLHKVCLALNGFVYYDSSSHIYYRQHGGNVVGGEITTRKRWRRRINTLKNNRCPRSKGIREILLGYGDILPTENKIICEKIVGYNNNLVTRLKLALDKSIYSNNARIDFLYRMTVLLGLF